MKFAALLFAAAAVNVALRVSRTWRSKRPVYVGRPSTEHERPAACERCRGSFRKPALQLDALRATMNALDHPNYAPPNGDLSSPYFGQYRLELRFTF